MDYHVTLGLSPEQRRQLKMAATQIGQSVKDFVTGIVLKALADVERDEPAKRKK